MKKRRKNPHAVALGRLGGLVRSEAKRRANRENGRKGGLVKSRKKRIKNHRAAQRQTPTTETAKERVVAAVAAIRLRFGCGAIGLGCGGIRYFAAALR
jgi:hypothetical protein